MMCLPDRTIPLQDHLLNQIIIMNYNQCYFRSIFKRLHISVFKTRVRYLIFLFPQYNIRCTNYVVILIYGQMFRNLVL